MPKDVPEPGDKRLMKDIVLDQASDRSADGKKSRRKASSNDQTFEYWETIDHQRGSIDVTVGKPGKPSDLEDRRENLSPFFGIDNQLEETEETIQKLSDYGKKLNKKIKKSASFDAASTADSVSDGGSGRRRRCSEQARRMSEEIGRLQLDVQKMHFVLMKLDKNKVGQSGTGVPEWNTRVLLRDYLYGHGFWTPRKRIKIQFCGCVRPSSMDD
ncbi:hypothetical protein Cgig2_004575 [Carnegiea gigantea]|nr:hypothetical protein Cgig2_004575 [Carnegiea gigantea]